MIIAYLTTYKKQSTTLMSLTEMYLQRKYVEKIGKRYIQEEDVMNSNAFKVIKHIANEKRISQERNDSNNEK